MRETASMRRTPTQQRGEQRVQEILDATEELVLEIGADSITTNHIARRAGVNVGTVYHFFADKLQIYHAVISRAVSELQEQVRETVSKPAVSDVEWLDRIIDVHEGVWHNRKGSIRLWESVCRYPEISRIQSRYYDRMVPEYVRGLKDYCPRVPASRRGVIARIVNDVLIALLDDAAAATSSRERDARLREMRILLRAYVCGAEES